MAIIPCSSFRTRTTNFKMEARVRNDFDVVELLKEECETFSRANLFSYWVNMVSPFSTIKAYAYVKVSFYTGWSSSGGGGCGRPYVAFFDGREYIFSNNILPQCEYDRAGGYFSDSLLITDPLIGSSVRLKIAELDNDVSYLKKLELYRVLYPQNCEIALSHNGSVLAWYLDELEVPKEAVSRLGGFVSAKLAWADYVAYRAEDADTIRLDFTSVDVEDSLLVLRIRNPRNMSINIKSRLSPDAVEISFVPKIMWEWYAISLRDLVGSLTHADSMPILLKLSGGQELDFVAIAEKAVEQVFLKKMEPRSVKLNDIPLNVDTLENNKTPIVLAPRDALYISFEEVNPKTDKNFKTAYLLRVIGRYERCSDGLIASHPITIRYWSNEYVIRKNGTWVQVPIYHAWFPSTTFSVSCGIYIKSSGNFVAYIDAAYARFALDLTSEDDLGVIKLTAVVLSVTPLSGLDFSVIRFAIGVFVVPKSPDENAVTYLQLSVTRLDSDASSSDSTKMEDIDFDDVEDILCHDERNNYTESAVAIQDDRIEEAIALSRMLSTGSLILSVCAIFIPFLGFGALLISGINLALAFSPPPQFCDQSDVDGTLWARLPTRNESSGYDALTRACSITAPIEWCSVLKEGSENSLKIKVSVSYGTVYIAEERGRGEYSYSTGSPYYKRVVTLYVTAEEVL